MSNPVLEQRFKRVAQLESVGHFHKVLTDSSIPCLPHPAQLCWRVMVKGSRNRTLLLLLLL